MGLFSSFKVMTVKDDNQNLIVFRTSRAGVLLGSLFTIAGLGIIFQLLLGKLYTSLFTFCIFCLIVSCVFILIGIILITYRKNVTVNRPQQKISLVESSVMGVRSTVFHFEDVMNIELTRDSRCILADSASLWVVKLFVNHGDDFSVEKVFASICPREAKNVAQTLAFAVKKQLVLSCVATDELVLGRV